MIVAIIPAKQSSKRLPNKNMLEINGKPLVVHAIHYAKNSSVINDIYVSTDSDKIAMCAQKNGVGVIKRKSNLCGEVPLIDVYRHAWQHLDNKQITHIIGIQPDHPDRQINLDEAISYTLENKIDDLFTVDKNGKKNGSLRILSTDALSTKPSIKTYSLQDNCTNIHNHLDFLIASRNLTMKDKKIIIGKNRIDEGEPCFIIAEAACNHMCQTELAKKMIDLAIEAEANAVKFQTYKAERLVRKEANTYWAGKRISQLDYYRRLDKFRKDDYAVLFDYAQKKGIIAFSTPFDVENASMLNSLGMPLFKIASCDLPDKRLLRRIASFNKPIILSTGGSTPEEIDEAIFTIYEAGNYQLILLACTLSYPTKNEDANFLRIQGLKERYPGMIIGLSDHTEPDENMIIPSIGVALGARVIEKHYTLDRSMTGSGHFFSVNPNDLKKMVSNIRLTEKIMGKTKLGVLGAEEEARANARRSIVAKIPIEKGEIITTEMLAMKRPANGLPASMIDLVIGKRAKQDIEVDQSIILEMIE
jgi:sialic acid synthase SpsE/CMP-N-acetylneuraminic acid synthetase